jgi:hypothetical protein
VREEPKTNKKEKTKKTKKKTFFLESSKFERTGCPERSTLSPAL